MPQIFQVLRCYKCLVFQTHQTKKSNKWECKLCGEKQSVKRHYGLGTGKECRLQVQKLNVLRGERDENKKNENNSTNEDSESENVEDTVNNCKRPQNKNKSKWSDYVETHEEPHEPESVETMYLGEEEVVLEIPKKRKKNHNIIPDIGIGRNNYIKEDLKNPQFNIPLKSTQKTDNKINDDRSIISIVKPIVLKKENSKSQVIPPDRNRNSKWAQYTDDQCSQKNTLLPPTEVTNRNTQKCMFSLCEEGDLDQVLDI